MTALENVMLGRHGRLRAGIFQAGLRLPGMRREERECRERALEELRFMGLAEKAALDALSLPLGEQKLLEIARALATEPKLLSAGRAGGGFESPGYGPALRNHPADPRTRDHDHARGARHELGDGDLGRSARF